MRLLRSVCLLAIITLSNTLPFTMALPNPNQRPPNQVTVSTGKAIYILTNSIQSNAIAAIQIRPDGTLGHATLTPTGGKGAIAVDAQGKPAVPDALISQSAITVAGNHIFAVNAGSYTLSMLHISPSNPLSLTPIGRPASLNGGTFPTTITASSTLAMVCASTTGSKAGTFCGSFSPRSGIAEMKQVARFDLGQTDPPKGPTNTVSHTFFAADESLLVTTVKGDPAANKTGFVSVIPVRRNRTGNVTGEGNGNSNGNKGADDDCTTILGVETRSTPNGTAVLFGSAPIPRTQNIFATDASFGAAILSLSPNNAAQHPATLLSSRALPAQKATCWTTISPHTNTAFVTDVGVNRIVEMSLSDAQILRQIDLSKIEASKADPGLIDLRAAGRFVYALSPGNGSSVAAVSVVDVGRGRRMRLAQHAELNAIGVGSEAMGMAVLV